VAPAHFRTLRTAVVQGRALADGDRAGRPLVVVINEAAARRFWRDVNPLGQRVWFEGAPVFSGPDDSAEIVGIVKDVAYRPLDEQPLQPAFFTPYAQFTYASRMVLVRSSGDPRALVPHVAQAVRRADPDLALFDVRTMEERARLSWSKPRAQTVALGLMAAMALVLAGTGIYAATAFLVASRRRELGLRVALGATSRQVVRHSLARTARTGAMGVVAGLLGAITASQALLATLHDTSPLDPRVYAATIVLLAAIFLAASYVPVRRALRVDPAEVLRGD
jgi:putative ABC transport system permease protein